MIEFANWYGMVGGFSFGGGIAFILVTIIRGSQNRKKRNAEASKTQAEANKIQAEADVTISQLFKQISERQAQQIESLQHQIKLVQEREEVARKSLEALQNAYNIVIKELDNEKLKSSELTRQVEDLQKQLKLYNINENPQ